MKTTQIHLLMSIFISLISISSNSWAKTIFEGYYLVKLAEKPVGYAIQRYTFNKSDQTFNSTYLLQTNKAGGEIFEAVNAKSSKVFEPLSFKYTTKTPTITKVIDAKFIINKYKERVMKAVMIKNKKKTPITKKIKKGMFLSSFLSFVMLNNGYKVNKNFSYEAIAEEDAKIYKGTALIAKELKYNNTISAFKINNTFNGSFFTNIVSVTGEALQTVSPKLKISVHLVKDKNTALKLFKVKTAAIKYLFGNMPQGNINELHKTVKK